jgi:DNA mismatch repair protein MSH5
MIQVQSSFGIDLQQMSFALTQASSRSLLIIDEFGKGTQPDGINSVHQS